MMKEYDNCSEHVIILGREVSKLPAFKMLEVLCADEGSTKYMRNKVSEKHLNIDPLDNLKSRYKLKTEDLSTHNVDNTNKSEKRNCKRKLFTLSCKFMDSKETDFVYMSPLICNTQVSKNMEISKWFSQKLIFTNFASVAKVKCKEVIKQNFNVGIDGVYVSPIFYKSQGSLIVEAKRLIFNLYLKEWFQIELSFEYMKSITIYAKGCFIKISIRTKIADEISKLYNKYGLTNEDMVKCAPKKNTVPKDVMLVFTSKQLCRSEYENLVKIVGSTFMIWNDSDSDAKEVLENVLVKHPNMLEIMSNCNQSNWPLLFKSRSLDKEGHITKLETSSTSFINFSDIPPPPPPPPVISLDKIPPPPPMTPREITKIQSHRSVHSQNISRPQSLQHTLSPDIAKIQPPHPTISQDIFRMHPFTIMSQDNLPIKPPPPPATTQVMEKIEPSILATNIMNINSSLIPTPKTPKIQLPKIVKRPLKPSSTSKIMKPQTQSPTLTPKNISNIPTPQTSPQSQGVINYIVTTSTSGPPYIDPMPNIFHRIRADSSPTMIPYQFANLATLNQFIANGVRPSQPSMISLPVIVNVEGTAVNNANVVPKPVQSTNLMYVPGRNLTNVFETFHYNPSPESDVLIHGSDLLCLNFGQYLNDNIINFYLNYIRYELMREEQRQRTHLFNVFFNTKLQGTVANMTTDDPEIRHARVAKWTKKVDIFDKDFIIIPICENQHWFLAIICFPWMAGMISYDKLLGNNDLAVNEIPVNNSLFATKYRIERVDKLRLEGVEPSPCILLFDSLQYVSRAPNVRLIREYLKTEWDCKRRDVDGPLVFDKNTVRGFNPQVPQQTNNIDCGIFILHYVEQFFYNPLPVFTKEYFQSSLLSWFKNETVANKRATIQNMVLAKADAYQAQCESTSHNSSDHSAANIQQNIDDSGSDIQML